MYWVLLPLEKKNNNVEEFLSVSSLRAARSPEVFNSLIWEGVIVASPQSRVLDSKEIFARNHGRKREWLFNTNLSVPLPPPSAPSPPSARRLLPLLHRMMLCVVVLGGLSSPHHTGTGCSASESCGFTRAPAAKRARLVRRHTERISGLFNALIIILLRPPLSRYSSPIPHTRSLPACTLTLCSTGRVASTAIKQTTGSSSKDCK